MKLSNLLEQRFITFFISILREKNLGDPNCDLRHSVMKFSGESPFIKVIFVQNVGENVATFLELGDGLVDFSCEEKN